MGILSTRRRSKESARESARPTRDAVRESYRRSAASRQELIARHTLSHAADDDAENELGPAIDVPAVDTPFSDRHGRPLYIDELWNPAHLFLVSSGPSIRKLDLAPLRQRGICTMGLNNSPAIFRPDFWTFIDGPHKFLDAIWRDPGIMKFCPAPMIRKKPLREKVNGQFRWMGPETDHVYPRAMPSVVGYRRSACFDPDIWLKVPSVNWGNSKKHANNNGRPRILNVILAAVGIAYRLGFRVLNLLGVDFKMDAAQPYAFSQGKNAEAVATNNEHFALMNGMFSELRPHFEAAGFKVQNCNPLSGLTAFDYCRFETAVREATEKVQQDPLDTEGWYG